MNADARMSRMTLLGAGFLAATALLALIVWVPMVVGSGPQGDFTDRDWIAFYRTGQRLAQGDLDLVYPWRVGGGEGPDLEDGFYFLYPPFAAWLTRPLGGLGPAAGYAACVATVLLGTLVAFGRLLAQARTTGRQQLLAVLALVGSAPWAGAVFLGHLGSLLLVPVALALGSWARRHGVLTGAFLGILLVKPNLGLPILALVLVGRRWHLAAGMVLMGAAMVVASVPLGPELWADWWQTMGRYGSMVSDNIPVFKQSTLLATLRSLSGLPGSHPMVLAGWLTAAALLVIWTACHWIRLGHRPEAIPRLLSVSLLTILVSNPYAYGYDLLLATPAALSLWTAPSSYRKIVARRWSLAMTLGAYYLLYAQLLGLIPHRLSLTGVPLTVWLVLELRELEGDPAFGWAVGTPPVKAPSTPPAPA